MAKGKKTGGRKPNTPNKVVGEIKELARQYGPAAVRKLAELAGLIDGIPSATTETAIVAANRDLLDRGYGKPTQGVELAPTEGLERLLDRVAGTAAGRS